MIKIFIVYENPQIAAQLSIKLLHSNISAKIIGFTNRITKSSIDYCNSNAPNVIISKKNNQELLKKHLTFEYIHLEILDDSESSIDKAFNQLYLLSRDTKYTHKLNVINFKKQMFNNLIDLKFNPNLCGTKYLLDCIVCIKENPYSQVTNFSIMKYLKNIAMKYGTSLDAIIWNLRTTIEDMVKYTNSDFRKNIYGTEDNINYQTVISSICAHYSRDISPTNTYISKQKQCIQDY